MDERFVIEFNGRFMKVYTMRKRAENAFSRWMHCINTQRDVLRMIGLPSGHIYCEN